MPYYYYYLHYTNVNNIGKLQTTILYTIIIWGVLYRNNKTIQAPTCIIIIYRTYTENLISSIITLSLVMYMCSRSLFRVANIVERSHII